MITSKITNVTLHMDPFVEAWDLVIFEYTIIIIITNLLRRCWRWFNAFAAEKWLNSIKWGYLFIFLR